MKTTTYIIILLIVNIILTISIFVYIDYRIKEERSLRKMERMSDRIKATLDECDRAQRELKRSLYQY